MYVCLFKQNSWHQWNFRRFFCTDCTFFHLSFPFDTSTLHDFVSLSSCASWLFLLFLFFDLQTQQRANNEEVKFKRILTSWWARTCFFRSEKWSWFFLMTLMSVVVAQLLMTSMQCVFMSTLIMLLLYVYNAPFCLLSGLYAT